MKTHILLFVILCFSLGLKSQNDQSFPQENAVWHSLAFQYPWDMDDEYYYEMFSHKYFISGDTIIDDKTWNKIYFTNNYLGDVDFKSDMSYIAAIRENEQKQILAKFPELSDFVLYDFSLEVGDTIWYEYVAYSGVSSNTPLVIWDEEDGYLHYKVVVEKDSVLLENGHYRKRIILESFHAGYGDLHIINHWVEGLGCTMWSGLFHPIVVMRADNGDGITFACFMQDEEVIYLNNPYCDDCLCETFTSIYNDGINKDEIIYIYPNPTNGLVSVKVYPDYAKNATLIIADISGKKVMEKQVHNQPEITFDLSGQKSGIYIVQLLDPNNRLLGSKKIVLE